MLQICKNEITPSPVRVDRVRNSWNKVHMVKCENNLSIAEMYYKSMVGKEFDAIASYLHNELRFIGPFGEMHGKADVIAAAKNMALLEDISIR